jgi:hypothetical protein
VGVPPSESFRDGALLAVNLGDDADTTGAVYGQLAGAFYGEDGIPSAWREKLALRGTIERFAELLHGMSVARGRGVSGESALTRATREVADEWRSKGVRCPFRRTDFATETTTSSGTRSNGVCGTTPRASDGCSALARPGPCRNRYRWAHGQRVRGQLSDPRANDVASALRLRGRNGRMADDLGVVAERALDAGVARG